MGRSVRAGLGFLSLAGLVCLVPSAYSQAPPPTRVILNRPSAQTASQRMDRIGGRYTRDRTPLIAPNVAPASPNQLPTMATMMPPRRRAAQGGGYVPAPQRLGLIPSPDYRSLFRRGTLSEQRIGAATGFLASISANAPLYGYPPPTLRMPEIPRFEVETGRDEFHRFFDLVPTRRPEDTERRPAFDDLMAAVDQNVDADVQRTLDEAVRLFRLATGASGADGKPVPENERNDLLRRAIRLFASVRDLAGPDPTVRDIVQEITALDEEELPNLGDEPAPESVLANLLLVHAYLERYRSAGLFLEGALFNLFHVAQMAPEAFRRYLVGGGGEGRGRDTLAAYFGDYADGHSEAMESQLRQYLRMVSREPPSPETYVFQAYCALALGDPQRARTALDRAEAELDLRRVGGEAADRWQRLIAALRYALEAG